MEPGSSLVTALAAKGGEAALADAQGFLKKIFGPSADVIGENLALRFRERMFDNLVDVLMRTKEKIKAAGLSPKEAPLKVIHPLLEAASLEEEPELRDLWANLLANAVDPRAPTQPPSFREIMKELTAREVRFLHVLMEASSKKIRQMNDALVEQLEYTSDELHETFIAAGLTRRRVPISKASFEPNGDYWDFRDDYIADADDLQMTLHVLMRNRVLSEAQKGAIDGPALARAIQDAHYDHVQVTIRTTYSLTSLGVAFLLACDDPSLPPLLTAKTCFDDPEKRKTYRYAFVQPVCNEKFSSCGIYRGRPC
jgi:hypothetical protein